MKIYPVLAVAALLAASVVVGGSAPAAVGAAASAVRSGPTCDAHQQDAVFTGRGSEMREPDLGEAHNDLPESAKGQAPAGFQTTIPVYLHVVTDGTLGALTDAQIDAQMRVLNATFGGREGGATTGFTFELAGVTRTDNPAWFYAGPGGTNENSMKKTLRRGGAGALNFYSTTAGPFLGWAYLPEIVTKPGQVHLDGVVIDWASLPRTSDAYAGQFDLGKTATHEIGHWLDLEHTFYGGCSAKGDFVDDTPAQKTPTTGCPEGKDTCRAPGLDPIHNYMDYSFDACYSEFTLGQTQRMRDAWMFYRAG